MVSNADGNGSQPAVRTWTVEADRTRPTVGEVSLLAQATGVPVDTGVTATFSEEMDASTVSGQTFLLTEQGGSPVAAGVSYDAATNTATLEPAAGLEPRTTYATTVTTGAKDRAGNGLQVDKVWAFTTAAYSNHRPEARSHDEQREPNVRLLRRRTRLDLRVLAFERCGARRIRALLIA